MLLSWSSLKLKNISHYVIPVMQLIKLYMATAQIESKKCTCFLLAAITKLKNSHYVIPVLQLIMFYMATANIELKKCTCFLLAGISKDAVLNLHTQISRTSLKCTDFISTYSLW